MDVAKGEGLLLVNFGGPRSLEEIKPFLVALLTDEDLIWPSLPSFLHRLLFTWIAKKRAKQVVHDYAAIGGRSPIFEDTERIAETIRSIWDGPVLTFHRYLPMTHQKFLAEVDGLSNCDKIHVFPMFPQFSYTTTGSIARWFAKHFSTLTLSKLHWIKSYADHSGFSSPFQEVIQKCLDDHQIAQEEVFLLFSAHGLPKRYISAGDPYQEECEQSFRQISSAFPRAAHQLAYQSLFGKEEWLRPYTVEYCKGFSGSQRNVIVVPLSFTSDHIETLFEIEQQHLPLLRQKGINAMRCPALNLKESWIDGMMSILKTSDRYSNDQLIRENPSAEKNPAQNIESKNTHRRACGDRNDPREDDLSNHVEVKGAYSPSETDAENSTD
jgi:ferrochelatase